jgi:hypothetical protein
MGGFALGGGGGGGTAPMHTSPQAMLQLLCAAHCLSQPALAAYSYPRLLPPVAIVNLDSQS